MTDLTSTKVHFIGPATFDRTKIPNTPYEVQVYGPTAWVEHKVGSYGETGYLPKEDHDPAHHGAIERELAGSYGVRWSMPGYMDCSEWSVYENASDAAKYAADLKDEMRAE